MTTQYHTAAQRAATGLDSGARSLILRVVQEHTGLAHAQIAACFFRDRFGAIDDYYAAVAEVYGASAAALLRREVDEAALNAEFPADLRYRVNPEEASANELLLDMPEPDFRLAAEEALRLMRRMAEAAPRVTNVCVGRGAPWRFDPNEGFQWVGDAVVRRDLVQPALAAINDPRFAGGVRSEFESARSELRQGTPQARKQAVFEAGCSVESAMKVVLDEHNISYGPRDTAQPLFEHLVAAGVVPRRMERLVLSAATPRNQTAGHGAGAVAHDPEPAGSRR